MEMRKILSWLLALVLALLPLGAVGETETIDAARAALLLQTAADAYSPSITAAAILGEETPDAALTRAAAARMIMRAFGPLPEPHYLRVLIGYWDTCFEDVPEGCAEAVDNLTRAGLLVPEDNTRFEPDAMMSEAELMQLVDRIHAYLGQSLRDDFCNTVNHDLFYETGTYMGEDPSYTSIVNYLTDELGAVRGYLDIINQALESDGSDESLAGIAAFMSTWMDIEGRNHTLKEMTPYLRSIEEAESASELLEAAARISRELGVEVLLDYNDDVIYSVPLFSTGNDCNGYLFTSLNLSEPENYITDSYSLACRKEIETRIFEEYGMSQEQAQAAVEARINLCHDAAVRYYEDTNRWTDCEQFSDVDAALPNLSLAGYMDKAGYVQTEQVLFTDQPRTISFLSCFDDEHLEGFRATMLYRLLLAYRGAVPPRLFDRLIGLYADYYSADTSLYLSDYFILYTAAISPIQWHMTSAYTASDIGIRTRQKALALIDRYVDAYSGMLSKADWLSEGTRKAAIEKLGQMEKIFIWIDEHSDTWVPSYLAAEEGGTIFQNITRYYRSIRASVNELVNAASGDPSASFVYECGPMRDSAFYQHGINAFYIPLGAMMDGTFAQADTLEEQMGDLGVFIGHEISHAYDNYYKKFVSSVPESEVWTEEDKAAFDARLEAMADLVGGYEYGPGLSQTGANIVREACADNGFMCCSMAIAAEEQDFDYDLFFRTYAYRSASVTTRRFYNEYCLDEVHPIGRGRVNPQLMCFDEFYDTYGVTEGDGMYLLPEKRIRFWGENANP